MNTVSVKKVKIRKAHNCWGCARSFPAGTEMEVQTQAEHTIYSTYWCDCCIEYMGQDQSLYDDGIEYGGLLNNPEYEQRLKEYESPKALAGEA